MIAAVPRHGARRPPHHHSIRERARPRTASALDACAHRHHPQADAVASSSTTSRHLRQATSPPSTTGRRLHRRGGAPGFRTSPRPVAHGLPLFLARPRSARQLTGIVAPCTVRESSTPSRSSRSSTHKLKSTKLLDVVSRSTPRIGITMSLKAVRQALLRARRSRSKELVTPHLRRPPHDTLCTRTAKLGVRMVLAQDMARSDACCSSPARQKVKHMKIHPSSAMGIRAQLNMLASTAGYADN